MLEWILLRNVNIVRQSSGLVLADVLAFGYKVCEFLALGGRLYQDLPKFLLEKNAIINVKNNGNLCFLYAVARALTKLPEHVYLAGNYSYLFQKYGLGQINYPVGVADVPAIEVMLKMGINVYSFFVDEAKGRHPGYATKKGFEKTIYLLYWEEHYAWIKNFRRLMADLSSHNTLHWCSRYMREFDREGIKTQKL